MPRRGSIQNQATSQDASAAAIAWLPRDVLAGVLLRLPASDLRRFRHVCKEWREVISDPSFIEEHMDHGPKALTHTIVFFRGSSPAYRDRNFLNNVRDGYTKESNNGQGYLLAEDWRVTARFTVSESEDMVGTCNGLLCFLDVVEDAINIVEPFTGKFITLPLPPETERWHSHWAYCFGFDSCSRRYKILHLCRVVSISEPGLVYTYTVGEDTNWRRVHVASAAPGDSYWSPKFIDGAVYWSVKAKSGLTKLVRFDLATEEVTSELIEFRRPGDPTHISPLFSVLDGLDARVCLMTTNGNQGKTVFFGEGARWSNSRTLRLPSWRCLTMPQPLQRGHLLLGDYGNGGMYAHPIAPASDDLGSGNLVLQMDTTWQDDRKGDTDSNTRGLFIPVTAVEGRRVPHKQRDANTFCYAPPLCPAPLARYFGKL